MRGSRIREFIASEINTKYATVDGVLYNKAQQTIYKYPANKTDVSDYTLPLGCLTLYDYCFYDTNLVSITLDSATQEFGEHVFDSSDKLESIDMHMCQGMRNVGSYAFAYCTSLTNVTFPVGIQHFGSRVYVMNNLLTTIEVPDGTISLGEYFINSCDGITEFSLPDSVRWVVKQSYSWRENFYDPDNLELATNANVVNECRNLETVVASKYLRLNGWLTTTCSAVKHVTLPVSSYYDEDGIEVVVNQAFHRKYIAGDSKALTDYTIPEPDNGTHFFTYNGMIYQKTSENTCKLVNVPYATPFFNGSMIHENATSIGDSCFEGNLTVTVEIPDTITEVGATVFKDCNSLLSVKMSKNVKVVKNRSFLNCQSLSTVVYPSTAMTTIEYQAFYNCPNISSLTIASLSVPTIDDTNSQFKQKGYHPFGQLLGTTAGNPRNPAYFIGCNVTGAKKFKVAYFENNDTSSLDQYASAQYWYDPLLNPVNVVEGVNEGGSGFQIEYLTFNEDIYVAFFDRNGDQYEYAGTDTTQVPYGDGQMGIYQAEGDYAGYYKFSFASPVIANKPIQFTKGQAGDSFGTLRPQVFEDHHYTINYGVMSSTRGIKLSASEPVSDTVSRYDYDLLVSRLNSLETKLRNIAED